MKYYIGFDCGTQSTKTVIYSGDAECVAEHIIPSKRTVPAPNWLDMDADHYVESVREGIRQCLKKSGINPSDVRAICGDGIICGIVGIGPDGKAITPYITYLDGRTIQDAQWIEKNIEPFWAAECGNRLMQSWFPPMFARWFLKNDKAFQERGVKVMNNGPYVLSRLANLPAEEAFTDWATMSGWVIGFDAVKKRWSERQMEALGIPMRILPKIVKPWDIVGHLCDEEARNTGLPAGVPIVAGAGDTMQSLLGCGLVDPGMAADVAGTAAMFAVVTDGINEKLTRNTNLIFNTCTLPDTYMYWGIIRAGGLSLSWFRDNVCSRGGDASFYSEIQEKAEKVPAGSNGTLFIPYLTGGESGGNLEHASGCFLNMTTNTEQGEMWRAVMESIAYEYLEIIDKVRENGIKLDSIVITEGGSKNDLWNQIKSDILDVRVSTMKRTEGAVMSNIAVAAYAVGDSPDIRSAMKTWIVPKKTYEPNAANTAYYRKVYDVQRTVLSQTMPATFKLIKPLQSKE
ncbi:MAG: carbohydrate kinase [Synergistaceae bacterium]|nr:carbohydrate kinase [Synergistaceae bacterium]